MKFIKTTILHASMYTCLLLTTAACDKDNPLDPFNDCGSAAWTEQVQVELTAWSTAIGNYASDPTSENCTAFKTTGKAYLDALEDVRACVGTANQQAYNQAIAEAKVDLDETDCSDG